MDEPDSLPLDGPPATSAQISVPRAFPVLVDGERPVPAVLRVRVLFGGRRQLMACLWLALASTAFWGFDVLGSFNELLPLVEPRDAYATIVRSEQTSASEEVTDGPSGPVWRYVAEGTGDDGAAVSGQGYVTAGGDRSGARVVVRYAARSPQRGVIVGMRASTFGGFGLLLLCPILIAIGVAVVAFGRAARDVELLTHGKLARARLISKDTAVEKAWRYTFTYDTERGPRTLSFKSQVEHTDEEEPLLYDGRDGHRHAVLLGELAGEPRVSPAGSWEPSDWEWWFALAPLTLVVLANLGMAVLVR